MKTLVLAIIVSTVLSSCSNPPVSGTVSHKLGTLTLDPQGRVIVVVEPKSGK